MSTYRLIGVGIILLVFVAVTYVSYMVWRARKGMADKDAEARIDLDLSNPEDMNEYRRKRQLLTDFQNQLDMINAVGGFKILLGLGIVIVMVLLWVASILIRS